MSKNANDFDKDQQIIWDLDATDKMLDCILAAVKENHPKLHKSIHQNCLAMTHSLRIEMGNIGEDDIEDYAHYVADRMESYFPTETYEHRRIKKIR